MHQQSSFWILLLLVQISSIFPVVAIAFDVISNVVLICSVCLFSFPVPLLNLALLSALPSLIGLLSLLPPGLLLRPLFHPGLRLLCLCLRDANLSHYNDAFADLHSSGAYGGSCYESCCAFAGISQIIAPKFPADLL